MDHFVDVVDFHQPQCDKLVNRQIPSDEECILTEYDFFTAIIIYYLLLDPITFSIPIRILKGRRT